MKFTPWRTTPIWLSIREKTNVPKLRPVLHMVMTMVFATNAAPLVSVSACYLPSRLPCGRYQSRETRYQRVRIF
jgi:hypothetical protein